MRIGFGRVDLSQQHRAVRPREIEDAIGEMAVVVLRDESERGVTRLRNPQDDIDDNRLVGLQRDPLADGDNRIEHRAFGPRERSVRGQCLGRCETHSAPDEARAIGLIRHRARMGNELGAVRDHQVQHERRLLVRRSRPSRAQNRVPLMDDLSLHEQIRECGMRSVSGCGREHDLGIARHLDRPLVTRTVANMHPPELDIVLGRYDDLGVRVVVATVDARPPRHLVAATKLCARFGEDGLIAGRTLSRRMMCG